MKKYLSILVATVMLLSVIPINAAAQVLPFEDVSEAEWYYAEVQFVYEKGIMQGKADGIFAPKAEMTRAELVTLLSRMTASDLDGMADSASEMFSDVEIDQWFTPFIGWGVDAGIVSGYSDGTFRPNEPVSRQELAVMILRFIKYSKVVYRGDRSVIDTFTDVETISDWAVKDVEKLRITGIVGGDAEGCFNPKKSATRAEIARIAHMLTVFIEDCKYSDIENDIDPDSLGVFFEHESGIKISNTVQFMNGTAEANSTSVGTHGGHESKILRTEYGTFAVYLTGAEGNYDIFDVVKITDSGIEVLFTDRYPHSNGSCLPNIFAGEDGTVFVSNFSVCWANNSEGAWLTVYEINAETGKYTKNHSTPNFEITGVHGYGYSQPVPDILNGKIYALYTGGGVPGYLAWFIYDIDSRQWSPVCYTVKNDWRLAYFNAYADGNGGFYFVGQRDVLTSDLGPVIGVQFSTTGYIWDALYVYSIPNALEEKYEYVTVFEPEYTPDEEKGTVIIQTTTHYGNGCSYLDRDGNLHIIYTNSEKLKSDIYHAVYDSHLREIKNEKIVFSNSKNQYTVAMAQGNDGTYYIFALSKHSSKNGAKLEIWTSKDGLEYTVAVDGAEINTNNGAPFNFNAKDIKLISTSPRNNSIEDGVVTFMFAQHEDNLNRQYFFSVEIP